jgi:endo-1,4-beta-xylanase
VGVSGKQFNSLADAYKAFFQVYIKLRKTPSKHGVESITIWGLNDEHTWLNMEYQKKWLGNCDQYPLLFTKPDDKKWTYIPKPAFYAVIDAAK